MRKKKVKQKNRTIENKLPKITPSQIQIIKDIYKFRFITSNQFQKLFNHKDNKLIKEWLRDLRNKKYIDMDYKREDININRQPAKYFLTTVGRKLLKGQEGFDTTMLNKVYKEKTRKSVFKDHCLEVVDMYIFFRSHREPGYELIFFTPPNLTKYEYFPKTNFDAYFALRKKKKFRRFLLHVFNGSEPAWVVRRTIRQYIKYYDEGFWQANTDDASFPELLFVLPTEKFKKHIFKYGQALLWREITVDIHLFLTTKDAIKSEDINDIWQHVE